MDRLQVMTLIATLGYIAGLVGLTWVLPGSDNLKASYSLFFLVWIAYTALFAGLLYSAMRGLGDRSP